MQGDSGTKEKPYAGLTANDPRSSSQQSLLPEETDPDFSEHRRTLLLIYVHGFMGNEMSFQSFPAHVHNVCAVTLAETHVVHTKIYPRYRSRKEISVAAESFSKWLSAHESPSTDVILLGHSMGGLVCADVVLLPPYSPATGQALRHRILGTINFDVPFLGMHPGIISAGLSSIFRPKDDPAAWRPATNADETSTQSSLNSPSQASLATAASETSSIAPSTTSLPHRDTLYTTPSNDPNYNPRFSNDVILPVRKGWAGALHFVSKHFNEGLAKAGKAYVKSHVEFGSAMYDFQGLKTRYGRLRALAYEDEGVRAKNFFQGNGASRAPPKVDFINYYTTSTGIPKKPKEEKKDKTKEEESGRGRALIEEEVKNMTLSPTDTTAASISTTRSRSTSPRISLEEVTDGKVIEKEIDDPLSATSPQDGKKPFSETPLEDRDPDSLTAEEARVLIRRMRAQMNKKDTKVEDVPQKSVEPEPMKGMASTEPEAIKEDDPPPVAQDEDLPPAVAAARKAEREYLIRLKTQSSQPTSPSDPKTPSESFQPLSGITTASDHERRPSDASENDPQSATSKSPKPPRLRKFCLLPSKNAAGELDPTWVPVLMKDMDEVGAHCGLFEPSGSRYDRFVGEVAGRIESWVQEAESERVARQYDEVGGRPD